jgi:hypothetical protein
LLLERAASGAVPGPSAGGRRSRRLPRELREVLGDEDSLDVVAFTHLDRDRYAKATEFFCFEHVKKYQDDVDGERRIHMDEMWVPAAVITESLDADADTEAKAIEKEARERFKAKNGIRVHSRPFRAGARNATSEAAGSSGSAARPCIVNRGSVSCFR